MQTPDYPYNPLSGLSWFRINFTLENTRYQAEYTREHLVSVINSIIKSVSISAAIPNTVFHLDTGAYALKGWNGKSIPVTVMINSSALKLEEWMRQLDTYFNTPGKERNFRLMEINTPEVRNLEILMQEIGETDNVAELCLDFHWPLPLISHPREMYNLATFLKSCNGRLERIFNVCIDTNEEEWPGINFLSHFQEYIKGVTHLSKSSLKKEEQWLQGFTGPVYINGEIQRIISLLAICAEWHAGSEMSNSMGYYSLNTWPRPCLDRQVTDAERLKISIEEQCAESDYFEAYVAGFDSPEACREHLLEQILTVIRSGEYSPQGAIVTLVPKSDGGTRTIEQLQTEDEVIQQFLYEQVKQPFDHLFDKACIGFRKGYSRKKSAQLLEEAIGQGYGYVIHTDIEDYFPSISHPKLIECIRKVVPLSDEITYRLLVSSIAIPLLDHGTTKPRQSGIAQGSSLSPLLANLYLDAFDEYVAGLPVQMIRFADDLLILCKTEADAHKILVDSAGFLEGWGLHFKKSKTFIGKATDPFLYLGLQFTDGRLKEEEVDVHNFKKRPLFILEPYSYLAFHKGSLQVYCRRRLTNTIPLSTLSAIIAHYQVVISGVLIGKCLQEAIPVTLTLSNAYHLTTIKPNTKTYHDTLTLHGLSFYQAGEAEKFSIAREIAIAKFENIVPLFRQRHSPNTREILEFFREGVQQIIRAQDIDQVRGHEGYLTRRFYEYFNGLLDIEEFKLVKRDRNGKDPMNAMLNFSSYLLMAKLNGIIRSIGLNPYLGFLHSSGNSYESLVYDVMECFRGRLYRLILRIINLKVIQYGDFEITERGAFLDYEARKRFITQFEKELNTRDKEGLLTLREHLYAQVIIIKNWACEQKSLTFYEWRV